MLFENVKTFVFECVWSKSTGPNDGKFIVKVAKNPGTKDYSEMPVKFPYNTNNSNPVSIQMITHLLFYFLETPLNICPEGTHNPLSVPTVFPSACHPHLIQQKMVINISFS